MMMHPHRSLAFLVLASAVLLVAGCGALPRPPVGNLAVPQPARPVDLNRYAGVWYELARYDNGFERNCEGVTAEYRPQPDGTVQVLNTCHKGAPGGPTKVAKGRAKVVPGNQNGKLKVSFFGPFWGDYWVLDHAEDYAWSIVGEPSGRYLWVLSRTPHPAAATSAFLDARAKALGYDTSLIRRTRH